jgi:DNA polymerase-3 subunit alpha
MFEDYTKYDYPKFGWIKLPAVQITDEELTTVGAKTGCSNYDFLRQLVWEGYKKLTPKGKEELYKLRVIEELELFNKLGFIDYILLIWKIYNYCNKNNIATGMGRGSAPSALLFYLIGVTKKIDPIKYKCFLARFVSEARMKQTIIDGETYIDGSLACDFDADIDYSRRAEVVDYIKTLYNGKICKISTRSTLSGKILIKECCKIIGGYSEEESKEISDFIPKIAGFVSDLEDARKKEAKFDKWCSQNPEIYQVAIGIENLIRNKGSHASGYVVAEQDIDKFLPVQYVKAENDNHYEMASSFTMDYVCYLTIKLDVLGIRCLSVVADVMKQIPEKLEDINLDDDPLIYNNLKNLTANKGLFQIEQPGTFRVLKKVGVSNLTQLSVVNALTRPGGLSYIDQYSNFLNKGEKESVHPFFDDILVETGYIPAFQEQLMAMANKVGFTLVESEQLRRIVGKKDREKIKIWEEKINDKIKENNLDPEIATVLWKVATESASYSFNRSHSVSYSLLTALTAYCKFKYPLLFFRALLSQSKFEPSPIAEVALIARELSIFGIKLLPPDLTKHNLDFEIEGSNIRFGLQSIKGVSDKTIKCDPKFPSRRRE